MHSACVRDWLSGWQQPGWQGGSSTLIGLLTRNPYFVSCLEKYELIRLDSFVESIATIGFKAPTLPRRQDLSRTIMRALTTSAACVRSDAVQSSVVARKPTHVGELLSLFLSLSTTLPLSLLPLGLREDQAALLCSGVVLALCCRGSSTK